MCDPMTAMAALSLGASVGGNVLQSNEAAGNQAAAITAKNNAMARTLASEKALQDQSSNIFQTTLQPFQGDGPAQALQSAQAADTSAIANNAPAAAALAAGATTGNAPKVVQDDAANSVAARQKDLASKGAAFGDLLGYGTQGGGIDRTLADSRLKIGSVGDFARGRAAVGGAQMDSDILNSQKAPSPFGDILKGVGQIGSYYAGTKGGPLFGPKTPVPPTPAGYY